MPAFAARMDTVHKSFIREILKVTQRPEVISFAGGLPNPALFPAGALADAAEAVLRENGAGVLQYTTTEGYLPLRRFIAGRYRTRFGLSISPDEILITNGSQQGLDLLGKVFLNKGDSVLLELPSYLGAIQAFSIFEPNFCAVPLLEDGPDLTALEATLAQNPIKLFYGIPNFQNPSGISYSAEKRPQVAELLKRHGVAFVEDDPYGELRFAGTDAPSLRCFDAGAILLGSFSKIVAPGLRIGWIVAPPPVMEKLIIAKQGADLHSNHLSQQIICHYLQNQSLDDHIDKIRQAYGAQQAAMTAAIEAHFPPNVRATHPEGGMFLWVTLPQNISAMDVLTEAGKLNVAFVPGQAFYANGTGGQNAMRLNFSNVDPARIETGIRRLAQAIKNATTSVSSERPQGAKESPVWN